MPILRPLYSLAAPRDEFCLELPRWRAVVAEQLRIRTSVPAAGKRQAQLQDHVAVPVGQRDCHPRQAVPQRKRVILLLFWLSATDGDQVVPVGLLQIARQRIQRTRSPAEQVDLDRVGSLLDQFLPLLEKGIPPRPAGLVIGAE